jgi:hypothetical protein
MTKRMANPMSAEIGGKLLLGLRLGGQMTRRILLGRRETCFQFLEASYILSMSNDIYAIKLPLPSNRGIAVYKFEQQSF